MSLIVNAGTTELNLSGKAKSAGLPGSGSTFGEFIGGILGGIMVIAAVLVLLYLLWGAFEWITSGGDKGKVEKARDKITQAVVGLIVLSATTAIFMLLQSFLGICILNIGNGCHIWI